MKLTCYTWTTCQHTEHKNEAGEHVGITEILNEANKPIRQQAAAYQCPACADPNGNHDGIGIRPVLQASTNVAASPASAAQTIRSFNPQVLAFQPTVAQNSDLYSNQPAVFHNSQIYSKPSTVSQNNGIYPSMPTGPQHDDSHTNSYPGYGLYTADMHNARNNINTPGEESINHTAPYGAFNTAATEPDHFSNVHSHVHSHGHTHIPTHVHATERQGTTYFGYPEGDVEGLIISHNSLGNHNHNYVPTEAMVPQDQFVPTSVLIPYDSVLARKNAAKAAVLKKDEHKPGKPCPDGHPNCHWHYSRWCHESPVTCRSALQAITAAFHAHGPWKDAPLGWNEVHEPCVRAINPVMCEFHDQIQRRIYGSSFDQ